MKLNKKLAAALVAFPLLVGSFSTLAGHHKGPGPGLAKMISMKIFLKDVNLTDEQKKQLKAIRKEAREQKKAAYEANKEQRLAQQKESSAIVTASTFNEPAALKLAQDMAAMQIKSRVENMRNQQKMFSILTPEQQAKVKANIENFKAKIQDKMQRKGKE